MPKKRIFNNRPVCFFAFFLTFGIITGEALSEVDPLFRIIPMTAFIIGVVLFAVFGKTRRFTYIWIASLIGLFGICGTHDIVRSITVETGDYLIQARVASEIIVDDQATRFYIDEIYIDGRRISGRAQVYFGDEIEPDFGAGDVLAMYGNLYGWTHTPFDTYFANGIAKGHLYGFNAYAMGKASDGEPPFPLNIQLAVKKLFYYNMDGHSASICQALVLGDKRGMDHGLYDNVKAGGLAHILAVSGLHITAVAGAFYWLLKKLKVKPKISFLIVNTLTFLYVMLCSFTPSALRAFIMVLVFSFSSAFGFKRDDLSALSLAACLILIFCPISLMEVGYLLSMFAMLGIILFYKPINAFLMRGVSKISPERKIGTKAAGLVSVSLATNLATYPLTAYFFRSVPVLFILSNLLILPYMMFIYLFLIIITAFSLITTLSGVVGIMDYLLRPFIWYVSTVGSVSFALVPAAMSVAGIVEYSFCMPIISRFVFLTRKQKLISVLSIFAIALAVSAPLALI